MIFTEWYNESWAILLLILGIFGLIALGVFLLRKFILNKNNSEEIDLEKAADENKLMSYIHNGFWQCMDSMREKVLLEEMWNQNKALWAKWRE